MPGFAALIVLGLVLLTGIGGMTSFGQAAFAGCGAYTASVMTTQLGVSPWLGLVGALAVTLVVALLVGAVMVRLSAHYMSLGTLAWGISFFYIFSNTGRLDGHNGIGDTRAFYVVVWLAVMLGVAGSARLLDSRVGRAIRALRQGTVAAEAFVIGIARMRLLVFVFAALLAGLSGWLFAHFQHAISPGAFDTDASINALLMVVIGGSGHLAGALVGAGAVTLLRNSLQDLLGYFGNYEDLVHGILLVAMLQVARDGLWPMISRVLPAPRTRVIAAEAERLSPLREQSRPAETRAGALLELRAGRKQFGGLVAVDDVSFAIGHGEIVALIGPNGAGKSTMFDLITGFTRLTAGEVRLGGTMITGMAPRAIARLGLARSFQHVRILPEISTLENAAIGVHLRRRAGALAAIARRDRREEAMMFAEAAGCLRRTGLGADMFRPASHLALGRLRTLEIARALCLAPRLLLLDGPAAGLRAHEKAALAHLLAGLRREGMSILLVEHDVDFVMNLPDRLVVLNFGGKIAEGTQAEIRGNPAVIEACLGAPE